MTVKVINILPEHTLYFLFRKNLLNHVLHNLARRHSDLEPGTLIRPNQSSQIAEHDTIFALS